MIGWMIKKCDLLEKLDIMIPDPKCELNYNKDYELLIATVLSAQCTDARVNMVTKELFSKYDIYSFAAASINDIKKIIKSVGTYTRKSEYIIEIACINSSLVGLSFSNCSRIYIREIVFINFPSREDLSRLDSMFSVRIYIV